MTGFEVDGYPGAVEICAAVAHEVNRAYCLALGDASQPPWAEAPDWQKNSARHGVALALLGAGPGDSHGAWLRHKQAEGWIYGPVKDPEAKVHPCMVPFDQLPKDQQVKDFIFIASVRAAFAVVKAERDAQGGP